MIVLDDKCICPACKNFKKCVLRKILNLKQLKLEDMPWGDSYKLRFHLERCPRYIRKKK